MAKPLYAADQATGIVYAFDGASWSSLGGSLTVPLLTATAGQVNMFVYNGNLYVAYIDNTSTLDIYLYDPIGITYTLAASIAIAIVSNPIASYTLSRVINYRDKAYFLLTGYNASSTPVVIFAYAFDGSIVVSAVYNATTFSGANGLYALRNSFYAGTLVAHDSKLLWGPRCCYQFSYATDSGGADTYTTCYSSFLMALDFNPGNTSGVILSSLGVNGATQVATAIGGLPSTYAPYSTIQPLIVGTGTYNGQAYVMTAEGLVKPLNSTTGAVGSTVLDFRSTRLYNDGIAQAPITSYSTLTVIYNQPQATRLVIGTRIMITSGIYSGITGIITCSMVAFVGGQAQIEFIVGYDDGSGNIWPQIPTGVTYRYWVGCGGLLGNDGGAATTLDVGNGFTCLMQRGNTGFLYIFTAGRNRESTFTSSMPPSTMIKWDGTPNPTGTHIAYFSLTSAGLPLDCWAADDYFDETSGIWHILYSSATAGTVNHLAFNTNNDTSTLYGSVYSNSGHVDFGVGTFVGYVANDQTTTCGSSSFNATTLKNTVTYWRYSQNSASFNIFVRFNDGGGWAAATLVNQAAPGTLIVGCHGYTGVSGPSGVMDTFVHDIATDLPTFSGAIQYEITSLGGPPAMGSSSSSSRDSRSSSSTSSSSS